MLRRWCCWHWQWFQMFHKDKHDFWVIIIMSRHIVCSTVPKITASRSSWNETLSLAGTFQWNICLFLWSNTFWNMKNNTSKYLLGIRWPAGTSQHVNLSCARHLRSMDLTPRQPRSAFPAMPRYVQSLKKGFQGKLYCKAISYANLFDLEPCCWLLWISCAIYWCISVWSVLCHCFCFLAKCVKSTVWGFFSRRRDAGS